MQTKKFILSFFESKDKENTLLTVIKSDKEYVLTSSFAINYSCFDLYRLATALNRYFIVKELNANTYLITNKN